MLSLQYDMLQMFGFYPDGLFFDTLVLYYWKNSSGKVESPVTVAIREKILASLSAQSPLEHGSYVKLDPAGQWLSLLERTVRQKSFRLAAVAARKTSNIARIEP